MYTLLPDDAYFHFICSIHIIESLEHFSCFEIPENNDIYSVFLL